MANPVSGEPVLGGAERAGDAEVGDEGGAVGGEEQVLGLDVAVDHAVPVRVLERAGGLGGDPERRIDRQLPLPPEPVTERLALDERHGEPQPAGALARVEHGEDVRMLQPGGQLDLPLEPLGAERGRQLGMEHLQGDGALVAKVLGQVNGGHPAPAELALESVALR